MALGTHSLTATYNGNSNNLPSVSRVLSESIR
jgi:hypothetical protein